MTEPKIIRVCPSKTITFPIHCSYFFLDQCNDRFVLVSRDCQSRQNYWHSVEQISDVGDNKTTIVHENLNHNAIMGIKYQPFTNNMFIEPVVGDTLFASDGMSYKPLYEIKIGTSVQMCFLNNGDFLVQNKECYWRKYTCSGILVDEFAGNLLIPKDCGLFSDHLFSVSRDSNQFIVCDTTKHRMKCVFNHPAPIFLKNFQTDQIFVNNLFDADSLCAITVYLFNSEHLFVCFRDIRKNYQISKIVKVENEKYPQFEEIDDIFGRKLISCLDSSNNLVIVQQPTFHETRVIKLKQLNG